MHGTMSSSHRIVLCLALAIAFAAGCRTGGTRARDNAATAPTTIDIQHEDFNDMTVYVLVNGQRFRLGIAPGNKTTVLTIPRYLVPGTTTLRFVADAIGGHRTPVTEEIDVTPGDQLAMIINPGG